MSDTLVANELLAFLQQKLDVMDEVSAIQICATNFSEEDIAAAKLLVYRSVNKCDQMVSRRRDGTKKSLQDIITLLKETDPDDMPTFVAKDLNKLPPVTFDHVDVTSLLKDIVYLKASLADVHKKWESSEEIVTCLRAELDELRNAVSKSRSPARSNYVTTRRGGDRFDTSVASFASAVLSPRNAESDQCGASAPRASPAAPVPAAPPRVATRAVRPADPPVTASTPVAPTAKPVSDKASNQVDQDGFMKVQRKKRRQRVSMNCCGSAPAEPGVRLRAALPNTPVYVSRVHYTISAEDIVEYVRQKTKFILRVQLLESRRNVHFKSFVVRVPTNYLPIFLKEDFWPDGVVFRRFRGQVPLERTVT